MDPGAAWSGVNARFTRRLTRRVIALISWAAGRAGRSRNGPGGIVVRPQLGGPAGSAGRVAWPTRMTTRIMTRIMARIRDPSRGRAREGPWADGRGAWRGRRESEGSASCEGCEPPRRAASQLLRTEALRPHRRGVERAACSSKLLQELRRSRPAEAPKPHRRAAEACRSCREAPADRAGPPGAGRLGPPGPGPKAAVSAGWAAGGIRCSCCANRIIAAAASRRSCCSSLQLLLQVVAAAVRRIDVEQTRVGPARV